MKERDCEHCKHYIIKGEAINPINPELKLYGCELWECEFEEAEDERTD